MVVQYGGTERWYSTEVQYGGTERSVQNGPYRTVEHGGDA
jgi:hypothetical protein